jgi:hypothetical protein
MWILMADEVFVPTNPAFDIFPPSEPASPFDLQSSIRHLPAGFHALAFNKSLQEPILQKLCQNRTGAGKIRLNADEVTRLYDSFRDPPGSLDECVYFALLIYSFSICGRTRTCRTYLRTLQKLVDAVIALRPLGRGESDCVIWILTVAEAGLKVSHWQGRFPFMNYMLLHFPESRDRANWQKTLRRFFWNDKLGREWEEAWKNAMRAFPGDPLEVKGKVPRQPLSTVGGSS